MAAQPAPHAHRVAIRDRVTGQVSEVWPVDAREYLRLSPDQYELVSASPATADTQSHAAASPAAPITSAVPVLSLADQLAAWGYKDLQTLAKRAGLSANQKHGDLVAALVPLIEAKAVSLEELPPLAITPVQFPNAQAS